MSINGVSTNYYLTAYMNANTSKSTETASFADTIAEKAVSADDTFSEWTKIENAWNKTLKDTGIDPFPMNRISTALVIMVESGQRELGPNFPGDTIASVTSLVKRIIDRLENPLVPPQDSEYRNNELTFYRKFLDNLTA